MAWRSPAAQQCVAADEVRDGACAAALAAERSVLRTCTVTLPDEVRLATECAAALDRGDTKVAEALATKGLRLSVESPTWRRRFEHLLRIATGASIDAQPYVAPACSFCLQKASKVVAGPKTFICDGCVDQCASGQLESSAIRRVMADDIICSFCGRRSSDPVFAAHGYAICSACIGTCVEMRPS